MKTQQINIGGILINAIAKGVKYNVRISEKEVLRLISINAPLEIYGYFPTPVSIEEKGNRWFLFRSDSQTYNYDKFEISIPYNILTIQEKESIELLPVININKYKVPVCLRLIKNAVVEAESITDAELETFNAYEDHKITFDINTDVHEGIDIWDYDNIELIHGEEPIIEADSLPENIINNIKFKIAIALGRSEMASLTNYGPEDVEHNYATLIMLNEDILSLYEDGGLDEAISAIL